VIGWLRSLFQATPSLSEANRADAPAMASLHAACFHRGWSDGEFESFLNERSVIAHRVTLRGKLVGFILSRLAVDEAEILSVAVTSRHRGMGLARAMLAMHLRRLAGAGCRTVFLEVDETNEPARRLYKSAGFREVARRESYYKTASGTTTALVLRRDI
jgi:ribosomal-protein-alanine N-acetyltransferase